MWNAGKPKRKKKHFSREQTIVEFENGRQCCVQEENGRKGKFYKHGLIFVLRCNTVWGLSL